jgi:hypothetical protein
MSQDRRRPLQQNPIIDPAERLELRLIAHAETKPALKPGAAQAMALLRNGGIECAVLESSEDDTPHTLH